MGVAAGHAEQETHEATKPCLEPGQTYCCHWIAEESSQGTFCSGSVDTCSGIALGLGAQAQPLKSTIKSCRSS